MWFNTIGLTTNHEDVVITSFPSRYGKAAWPFFNSLAYRPAAIFLSLISLPFPYASLSFPSCLAKFILNSLLSPRGRKYSKTISACLAYKFCRLQTQPFPSLRLSQNDLIGSRSNGGHLENSSINNRHTATAFIHAFEPTSTRRNSLSLPSQHNFGVKSLLRNYSKTTPKLVLAKFLSPLRNYSKTTSKLVLAKFLSPLRNYSKTISKLVLAKYSALQNQPSCSPILTKWFDWLSPIRRPSWKYRVYIPGARP